MLLLQSSAQLCASPKHSWIFEPGSVVIASGHGTIVELGPFCTYRHAEVRDGGSLRPYAVKDSRAAQEGAVQRALFLGNLTIVRGEVVVPSGTVLAFDSDVGAGVDAWPTGSLRLMQGGRLECGDESSIGVTLAGGHHTFLAPSVVDCYITVGELASLNVWPDPGGRAAVNAVQTLRVQVSNDIVVDSGNACIG